MAPTASTPAGSILEDKGQLIRQISFNLGTWFTGKQAATMRAHTTTQPAVRMNRWLSGINLGLSPRSSIATLSSSNTKFGRRKPSRNQEVGIGGGAVQMIVASVNAV